ncbi:MAG TPA: hypothetical protein VHB27_07970 [Rhodopila sp.]|uniref:hypothetical protein n=1 Tax=Rhodopila sp. TaxID=2480087 RepID=UPI002CFD4AF1|nr:hypothetical protein [Rhodopila sp.]HVY15147.1 hypothetical protein [Rhodopila sp.]
MIRLAVLALVALLAIRPDARAQRDAIFEPLPRNLDWRTVAQANNLHFTLVPHGRTNIVLVWGGISQGDALRFAAALSAARPIDEIQFYSGGGNLIESLKIGAEIHRGGFSTRVPDGARCISACNFMFMGGIVRSVDPNGSFEVHMFSDDWTDRLRHELVHPPHSVAEFNRRHPNAAIDPSEVENKIAAASAHAAAPGAPSDAADQPVDGSKPVPTTVTPLAPPAAAATTDGSKPVAPQGVTLDDLLINFAIDDDVKGIQQSSAQIAAVIARYLVEMRLSLDFLTTFAAIPNSSPRPLSRAELVQFNVVNN